MPPTRQPRRINYCTCGKSTAYTFLHATADAEIWLASMSEIVSAVSTASRCSPATRRDALLLRLSVATAFGTADGKSESLRGNKNALIIIKSSKKISSRHCGNNHRRRFAFQRCLKISLRVDYGSRRWSDTDISCCLRLLRSRGSYDERHSLYLGANITLQHYAQQVRKLAHRKR